MRKILVVICTCGGRLWSEEQCRLLKEILGVSPQLTIFCTDKFCVENLLGHLNDCFQGMIFGGCPNRVNRKALLDFIRSSNINSSMVSAFCLAPAVSPSLAASVVQMYLHGLVRRKPVGIIMPVRPFQELEQVCQKLEQIGPNPFKP
ncbi:MAG: hypothetical protein ACOY9Y_13440 [Bacillota bacterium]